MSAVREALHVLDARARAAFGRDVSVIDGTMSIIEATITFSYEL